MTRRTRRHSSVAQLQVESLEGKALPGAGMGGMLVGILPDLTAQVEKTEDSGGVKDKQHTTKVDSAFNQPQAIPKPTTSR